jgi:hypothetical protein
MLLALDARTCLPGLRRRPGNAVQRGLYSPELDANDSIILNDSTSAAVPAAPQGGAQGDTDRKALMEPGPVKPGLHQNFPATHEGRTVRPACAAGTRRSAWT